MIKSELKVGMKVVITHHKSKFKGIAAVVEDFCINSKNCYVDLIMCGGGHHTMHVGSFQKV